MNIRVTLAALFLATLVSPPIAVADRISVYVPSGGGLTDVCNLVINDISHTLNIVHVSTSGAIGSSFRLEFDWGTGSGTLLSGTSPYASPPYSWFNGVTMNYGGCLSGEIFVAQIIITGQTNVECEAFLHVRPAVGNTNVLATDCADVSVPAMGGTLTINGDASCPCESTVPAHDETWGRIKSLYN